jgi:hypothetical protein
MMVKPGMPYLDVVRSLRDNTSLPIRCAALVAAAAHACVCVRLLRAWEQPRRRVGRCGG